MSKDEGRRTNAPLRPSPFVPRRLHFFVLLTVALLLDAWACWQLAGLTGALNDFFPRWLGTHLWLTRGIDPYSVEVDRAIAQAMVNIPGGNDQPFVFGFVYPGYVALLLVPLALLPQQLAATLWLLLGQVTTCAGAICAWRATERERALPTGRAIVPVALAVLFPAAVLNLVFFQFVGPVFFALATSWWLLVRRQDRRSDVVAGFVLALTLLKPSLGLIPTFALLLWAWTHGRRRVVASWIVTSCALVGASLIFLPDWPAAFLASTIRYAGVADATAAGPLLAKLLASPWHTSAPQWLEIAVSSLAVLAIALTWRASERTAGAWLAAGTLAGIWLIPPLYHWNLLLLLLVLLPWIRLAFARSARRGIVATLALVAASVATAPLIAWWPSESRAAWPLVALIAGTGVHIWRALRHPVLTRPLRPHYPPREEQRQNDGEHERAPALKS